MSRIQQTLAGTLLVFLLSLLCCVSIWMYQRRTLAWKPVDVVVVSSEIHTHRQRRIKQRKAAASWTSKVQYSVEGKEYIANVNGLPFGSTEVYVDPSDANNVVGQRGATMTQLFIPILGMFGSGMLAVVLALIQFSPKD